MPDRKDAEFGTHLVIMAAERNLITWQRLSLALMGLGFALDRFGLFIRLQDTTSPASWLPKAYTFLTGVGLVIAGSIVSAAAGVIYTRYRHTYARGEDYVPRGTSLLSLGLSMLVSAIGLVTAVFLITITD
jgi:putative membrane protein